MLKALVLALGALPFVAAFQDGAKPAQEQTAEQVYKNIVVFKGVPAKDLIPAMEFMSASMKMECTGCHEADFSTETRMKEKAREMVLLQRDINDKHFRGRLEVTCMTCHNGHEHPATVPVPEGVSLRHVGGGTGDKAEDLFKKHSDAVGKVPKQLTFKGTMTAPLGERHAETKTPIELVQAEGGKFALTMSIGKSGSDGKQVWKDGAVLTDEPAAIFGRLGRSWRGAGAFDGYTRTTVVGYETVGDVETVVVRGTRPGMPSTEELYFDTKSGLLVRMVNITRSSIGAVISVYDYSGYKAVDGVQVPMKITATWAAGDKWVMEYESAKTSEKVDDKLFAPGK
ncbi:MAG: photosynthetic reaction center cytochrome c subunit [Armatimonadetes bacterium]|nr:photosynthetic reaction center cytochrome c subunit [Armatimonadota bacterium]